MRPPLVQAFQQALDIPETWNRLHRRRDVFTLWRHKGTVALVALWAVGTSLVFSAFQDPVYAASAELLLQSRRSEQLFSPEGVQQPDVRRARIQTELRVLTSRSVREEVARILKREPRVTARAVGETDVVVLTTQGNDRTEAAREVNVYAETYISTRRQQLVDDLTAASDQVQAKAKEIEDQIQRLEQPLVELETRIAALDSRMIGSTPGTQRELMAERTQVGEQVVAQRRQIQGLQDQRSKYSQQLDQLQLASNLTQTGGAQIVSRAVPNDTPVRPKVLRDALLALAAGLFVGGAIAFWRERADTTVRDQEELELEIPGIDLLATIPHAPRQRWGRRAREIVSLAQPTSPAAEAYRGLRTSVQLLLADRPSLVLQFTSAGPGEGKTTMVANLAVALARAGRRVAVVDFDLRRPKLHKLFRVDNSFGMASLLDDETLERSSVVKKNVMRRVLDDAPLSVLPSGMAGRNPGELLTSPRAKKILAELKAENEFVLVDTPPVLSVADPLTLASLVDGTVIVVRSGKTTRKGVRRTLNRLRQIGARIVGTVLNDVEMVEGYGYSYRPTTDWSKRRPDGVEKSNGDSAEMQHTPTTVAREDQR